MRHLAPVAALAALLPFLAALHAGVARSADTDDPSAELRRIEKALEDERATGSRLDRLAGALAAEIDRLRARMAATANRAQRTEADMLDAEQTLDTLRHEAKETRARLRARRQELARLTGALQRLARHPPETLLLVGRAPLDTVHTGILLESAIPRLNADAEALRRELDSLATLEADIRAQRDRLDLAAEVLDGERAQLAAIAAEKADLLAGTRSRASDAADEIRALSESARSLRELIDSLQAREAAEAEEQRKLSALVTPEPRPRSGVDRGGPPPADAPPPASLPSSLHGSLPEPPPLSEARGRLFAPVAGTVVRRFGKGAPTDLTTQGLLLRTRPGALVIAPHDGVVLYAGPFEGFGRILIIEHGDGYHTLLAGLARVDLGVGSRILAGEPVGVMAEGPPAGRVGTEKTAPELYLELRHNGDPIDPLPWFAGLTEKAKG